MKWIFVFMWLFELEIEMLIVLSKGNIDKNKFHKVVLWKTMFCNIIERKNTSCRFSKLVGDEFHCFYTRPYLLWFAGDEFPYSLHHAKLACCYFLLSCLIFTPCQNFLLCVAVDELPYFYTSLYFLWFAGDELPYFYTMPKLPVVDLLGKSSLILLHHAKIACCNLLVMSSLIFYTMPNLPVVIFCWWAALFLHHAKISCCVLLLMSCLIFTPVLACCDLLMISSLIIYSMPKLSVVICWWWAPIFFTQCQNCLGPVVQNTG